MSSNPLFAYLENLNVPKDVKADVWDEFHAAQTPADFQKRFSSINVPREAKADLWDMKWPQEKTPSSQLQRFTGQSYSLASADPMAGWSRPRKADSPFDTFYVPLEAKDFGGWSNLTAEELRQGDIRKFQGKLYTKEQRAALKKGGVPMTPQERDEAFIHSTAPNGYVPPVKAVYGTQDQLLRLGIPVSNIVSAPEVQGLSEPYTPTYVPYKDLLPIRQRIREIRKENAPKLWKSPPPSLGHRLYRALPNQIQINLGNLERMGNNAWTQLNTGPFHIGEGVEARVREADPNANAWAGIGRGAGDFLDSIISPIGLATLGTSSVFRLPRAYRAASNAYWAAQMAKGVYDNSQELMQGIRENDPYKIAHSATGLGFSIPMGVHMGKGLVSEVGRPSGATPFSEKVGSDPALELGEVRRIQRQPEGVAGMESTEARAAENRAIQLAEDPHRFDELQRRYAQLGKTYEGTHFDADEYKKVLYPEWNEEKAETDEGRGIQRKFATAVHHASSVLAEESFNRYLETHSPEVGGKRVVQLYTGMAGAGKSTVLSRARGGDVAASFGGNFSSLERLESFVEKIHRAGYTPEIVHTQIDPLKAFDRMVTRGLRNGHFTPLEKFIQMAEVDENILSVHRELGTKVKLFNNDGLALREISMDDFVRSRYKTIPDQIREYAKQQARELWKRKLVADPELQDFTEHDYRKISGEDPPGHAGPRNSGRNTPPEPSSGAGGQQQTSNGLAAREGNHEIERQEQEAAGNPKGRIFASERVAAAQAQPQTNQGGDAGSFYEGQLPVYSRARGGLYETGNRSFDPGAGERRSSLPQAAGRSGAQETAVAQKGEIAVGDTIILPDGRTAGVGFVSLPMNAARVRMGDGSMRTISLSAIQPQAQKPAIPSTRNETPAMVPQATYLADRLTSQPEHVQSLPLRAIARTQRSEIDGTEARSGRQIVQPTASPVQNEELAARNAPQLNTKLSWIAAKIPGASFERLRPQKNLDRLRQKIHEGKPAQTISDYLAAQIAADTPEAKDRIIRELRREFEIIQVDDKFLKGRPDKGGYPSANLQVKFPNGGTAEVQIVPREVQEITDTTHHLYKEGRNARDAGDRAHARQAFSRARKLNREALDQFQLRNQLSKGQTVTLADGGKAVVQYVSPTMNVVRVRTAEGKSRTVRLNQIKKNS